MALRRDPLDVEFSLLVRERADWTCQKCGKHYPERKGQGLHCSHYWGRRNRATRWYGENCFAHCFACHQYLGANPHEFAEWVREEIGGVRYDELMLRANSVKKYTKADRKDMLAHFKGERERILQARALGKTGYIDFVEWDIG